MYISMLITIIIFLASLATITLIILRRMWILAGDNQTITHILEHRPSPISPVTIIHGLRDGIFWLITVITMTSVSLLSGLRAFFIGSAHYIESFIDRFHYVKNK